MILEATPRGAPIHTVAPISPSLDALGTGAIGAFMPRQASPTPMLVGFDDMLSSIRLPATAIEPGENGWIYRVVTDASNSISLQGSRFVATTLSYNDVFSHSLPGTALDYFPGTARSDGGENVYLAGGPLTQSGAASVGARVHRVHGVLHQVGTHGLGYEKQYFIPSANRRVWSVGVNGSNLVTRAHVAPKYFVGVVLETSVASRGQEVKIRLVFDEPVPVGGYTTEITAERSLIEFPPSGHFRVTVPAGARWHDFSIKVRSDAIPGQSNIGFSLDGSVELAIPGNFSRWRPLRILP